MSRAPARTHGVGGAVRQHGLGPPFYSRMVFTLASYRYGYVAYSYCIRTGRFRARVVAVRGWTF